MPVDKQKTVKQDWVVRHGEATLSAVTIDSYNEELRDGDVPSRQISKKKLDKLITKREPEAAVCVRAELENSRSDARQCCSRAAVFPSSFSRSDTIRNLSKAKVLTSELWRHADEEPDRKGAVDRLIDMLRDSIKRAGKERVKLAPFIGIGCPGLIRADGSIEKGGQNLPGDWEHRSFNLPALITAAIPVIADHKVVACMHNDAVVQGLSEMPFMGDVTRWGVMTMGTGVGNARFTNLKAFK